ncbi:MAG TPA: hypothetical protein VFN61_08305, partial [Acidimicrobiales bacterium]|nr:hypothetical protein [Acidimicrobiales bacterium]
MARQALATATVTTAGAVLAHQRVVPVGDQLAALFPEGGLRRGSTVCVGTGSSPGRTSLVLALLAEPTRKGLWCAVVGLRDLGFVAAARAGAELERLAFVPSPGERWPVVVAAMLEGFDVVVVAPPRPATAPDARKLTARARERSSVLVPVGQWPGPPDVRLDVTEVA